MRPKVRVGKFADIPAVVELMKDAHAVSRYACYEFNERAAKGLLMTAMQRAPRSQFVAVAETGEGVEGFVVGILQPLYFVLDAVECTDLFLHAAPGAHGATAARLAKALHRWAAERGAQVVRQGTTDAITDPKRAAAVLTRAGLTARGAIYEKELG